ncbi:MAG: CehA/McbA family metallohydrolase [Pyrinomonadaceae bacterium]|nr:CehA/McbA family metallohydrolase [Pyrinomonadaceae bacterium]
MTYHKHPDISAQHLLLDTDPQALTIPRLLDAHRLNLFYGDLHNHTGYSDGQGRPEDALRQMRGRGLHFAAITDHGEFFDRETIIRDADKWAAAAHQTRMLNDEHFVAIRGFEWSSPRQGHSNVWCSTEHTGYDKTGDESMNRYYEWLKEAQAIDGAQVLAGFNHPGREVVCFDGCTYEPKLDNRIVTAECFNRGDDYGEVYFRALDRGWHVGAIGVSDHHGVEWGSPELPRAGVLASVLTLPGLQAALLARQVFATRSPTLALLVAGNTSLMGARLQLDSTEPLVIGAWCNDPAATSDWTRLELWTTGGTLIQTHETRGLHEVSWRVTVRPLKSTAEHWFVVRVLHGGIALAYSSPVWARWQ